MRLLQLARSVAYVEVPAGFALIREGQKATRFCLLLQGSVVVSRRAPSSAAEANPNPNPNPNANPNPNPNPNPNLGHRYHAGAFMEKARSAPRRKPGPRPKRRKH